MFGYNWMFGIFAERLAYATNTVYIFWITFEYKNATISLLSQFRAYFAVVEGIQYSGSGHIMVATQANSHFYPTWKSLFLYWGNPSHAIRDGSTMRV